MGRIIPAGTGFPLYKAVEVEVQEDEDLDDEILGENP